MIALMWHLQAFVDCTIGAAGHTTALVEAHQGITHIVGLDYDASALELAKTRLEPCIRPGQELTLRRSNFRCARATPPFVLARA